MTRRPTPTAGAPGGHLRRLASSFLLLAAVLGAAVPGASPLPAQEARPTLSVDDLFRLERVGAPRVSPDGAWIAYTVSTTSLEKERTTTRIWAVAAPGREVASLSPADRASRARGSAAPATPFPLTGEATSASAPEWSPDGRYLTFLAARDGGRTQVWALDRRGGEAFALTDVKQGVGGYRWSPDGSRILLTIRDPEPDAGDRKPDAPTDPWVIDRLEFKRDGTGYLTGDRRTHLYVFHPDTRELRQLTTGRWDESLGVWSPDGTRVAFVSNRTEDPDTNRDSDIWVVAADLAEPTDAPTRVTTNPGADTSPAWSPDGRWIAHLSTTDVDAIWYATAHLAVIPDTGGEARILTRELDRNPSSPRWSDDGRWIWFGVEDSAEDHIARVRPDGTGLERPVRGPISAGAFDWAGGTFAYQRSTPERPAEIFAAPVGSRDPGPTLGGATQVTRHNGWLDSVALAETRTIHYPSADGTEIEGFVAFPPGFREGERYPVLLRIHGGPVSQYTHAFNFEAQLFAAHGYLVVYTNPRGSSGYGQAFSQVLFADWGNKDSEDVLAGVDHVIARGWGDPERLGVGGWSYGGILTNYVITKTDRFKGAISGASEVLYIANYGHDHYQYVWERELGLPWEGNNRELWERLSPFNYLDRVTTPTLVMGGEKDWNVPILNSEQLYQVLRRRGVPTQLVVYPDQTHGISVPSYQKDRLVRYLDWYDRWVKGKGQAAGGASSPG